MQLAADRQTDRERLIIDFFFHECKKFAYQYIRRNIVSITQRNQINLYQGWEEKKKQKLQLGKRKRNYCG